MASNVNGIDIISLCFSVLGVLVGIYGIYLAKNQQSNIQINVQPIYVSNNASYSPYQKHFIDYLFDDNNFWVLVILVGALGVLIKGQYASIALLISIILFFICVVIVIIMLVLFENRTTNVVKKYLLFFFTVLFSGISIWSFASPIFDFIPYSTELSSIPFKLIYYVFSGLGYGLCIICTIGSTISFCRQFHQSTASDRMGIWLFLSILSAFLQSGILTGIMYRFLELNMNS